MACGPAQVTTAPPQPVPKPVAPTLVTPARWSWPQEPSWIGDARRFEGVGLVLVGKTGRRALVRPGSRSMEEAPQLAPKELVGVQRAADGSFRFVARDATIFVAKSALDRITETHVPPEAVAKAAGIKWPTTGRNAVLVLSRDGRMARTVDGGASWQQSDGVQPAMKKYAAAHRAELDAAGRGLLITIPQKLFKTADDGATWKPVESPSIGAEMVEVDLQGSILLQGLWKSMGTPIWSRFDGEHFSPSEGPADLRKDVDFPGDVERKKPESSLETSRAVSLVSDDYAFQIERVSEDGEARFVKLSGPLSLPAKRAPLALQESEEVVSGDMKGKTVVLVVRGEKGSRLLTSTDAGETFSAAPISEESSGRSGTVLLTSTGKLLLSSPCSSADCESLRVGDPKGEKWTKVPSEEEMAPIRLVDDGKRAFVLGRTKDQIRVYETALDAPSLKITKLLDAQTYGNNEQLVDIALDQGVVRVVLDKSDGLHLFRMKTDGTILPELHAKRNLGRVSLAGLRGFASLGYETRDGGESWWKVETLDEQGYSEVRCSSAGCLLGDTRRLGWDVPGGPPEITLTAPVTPEKPGGTTASTEEEPAKSPKPKTPTNPPFAKCKPSGPPIAEGWPHIGAVDLSADIDWARQGTDKNGKHALVLAHANGKAETITMDLPGKVATEKLERTRFDITRLGAWVVRYSFLPKPIGKDAPYSPVDVDLVWWTVKGAKVRQASLPQLPPFRVGALESATVLMVGEELVIHPPGGSIYVVHADGKHDTLPAPTLSMLSLAYRTPDGTLGLVSELLGGVAIAEHKSGWVERRWTLHPPGDGSWDHADVGMLGGAPFVRFHSDELSHLLGLGGAAADPPLDQVVDPADAGLCKPGMGDGLFVPFSAHFKTVWFTFQGGKLVKPWLSLEGTAAPYYRRDTLKRWTSKEGCMQAETMRAEDVREEILFSHAHPTRAWLFGTSKTKGQWLQATPLRCTP